MKKGSGKRFVLNFILPVVATVILVGGGNLILHGIPLFSLPDAEEIAYVDITDERLDPEPRRITEAEEIVKARNIANFLVYKPGPADGGDPIIKLTYYLQDGSVYTVSANETTLYKGGKAHPIKGDNGPTFINVTEGLFFYDRLVEREGL